MGSYQNTEGTRNVLIPPPLLLNIIYTNSHTIILYLRCFYDNGHLLVLYSSMLFRKLPFLDVSDSEITVYSF